MPATCQLHAMVCFVGSTHCKSVSKHTPEVMKLTHIGMNLLQAFMPWLLIPQEYVVTSQFKRHFGVCGSDCIHYMHRAVHTIDQ
jgi:hypothetical protein